MKVIFLDFDGVVVLPDGAFSRSSIRLLNQVCLQTGANIVFSTSWKLAHDAKQLKVILLKQGLDKSILVLGSTPEVRIEAPDDPAWDCRRGKEISAWLEANPVESYVVLDDDIEQCHPHGLRCVKTETILTEAHCAEALRILSVELVENNHYAGVPV